MLCRIRTGNYAAVFILTTTLSVITLGSLSPPSDNIYQKVLDDLQYDDPRVPRVEREQPIVTKQDHHSPHNTLNTIHQHELLEGCTSKLQKVTSEKERCCSKPYFKQLVRKIVDVLQPMSSDESVFAAKIILTKEQRVELLTALEKQEINAKNVLDLFQNDTFHSLEEQPSVWKEWLLRLNLPVIILSVAMIPVSLLIRDMFLRDFFVGRNIGHNIAFIIFISFILSIPWEWYRMYCVAFAKKQSELMMTDFPAECKPSKEISMLTSISIFFADKLTWNGNANEVCGKYHENLLVDAIWEVSPLHAISVCISRFFFEPMKIFSKTIGVCFRLFFSEIPLQWQPFLFIAAVFLTALVIFAASGLRIETPLLKISTNNRREIQYIQHPPPSAVQPMIASEGSHPITEQLQTQKTIENAQKVLAKNNEDEITLGNNGVMEVASEQSTVSPAAPQKMDSLKSQHIQQIMQILDNLNEDPRYHSKAGTVIKDDLPSEDQYLGAHGSTSAVEEVSTSAVEDIHIQQLTTAAQCESEEISSPTFITNSVSSLSAFNPSSLSSSLNSLSAVHPSVRRVSIDDSPSSMVVPNDSSVFSMPLRTDHSSGMLRPQHRAGVEDFTLVERSKSSENKS